MREDNSYYTRLKNLKEEVKSDIGKPFFCDLIISERCNLRCKTCYFWQHGIDDNLTIEECKNFISYFKGWAQVPFEINLGGGEPLLNKEILDLVRYCVEQGLQPVISTNATLIDEEMAKKISSAGLHRLSISLHGLNEDTHDFVTGTKGAYRRLMRAIEYLKKYWRSGDMNIHTIILDQNIGEIAGLAEWVNGDKFFTGIAFQALAQPFRTNAVDRWYLDSEYSILWPKDPEKICSVIDDLINYKQHGCKIINPLAQLAVYKKYYTDPDSFVRAHRCNYGDYILTVNALGHMHLCCFMQPIGNIKKDDIRNTWYSENARMTRSNMYNCQKSCNNIVNCFFQEEGGRLPDDVQSVSELPRHLNKDKTERSIKSCDLLPTTSCMLRCKMCYIWNKEKEPVEELGLDEYKKFIDDISKMPAADPIRLHLGGGEPFLKDCLLDIIQFSAKKGLKTMITSNGFLIDKNMAEKIIDSGLDHITISLDAVQERIHDYLRGTKGSYRRAVSAIEYLHDSQNRPSIGVNCLISGINLDEIIPLAHWTIDNNRVSGIIFQAVVQPYETSYDVEWYKKDTFSELWPRDIEKVKRAIDCLIDLKLKGQDKISNPVAQLEAFKEYFHDPHRLIEKASCPMDTSSLLVNWRGQVYFCGLLQPIGNIRILPIGDILESGMAQDISKAMKNCRRNCNNKVNCFFKEAG